jgi:hypothetical protein
MMSRRSLRSCFSCSRRVFWKLAELRHGPFELTREALAVHAQVGQRFRLAFEGRNDGHCVLDLGRGIGEVVEWAGDAHGEEICFEGRDAVEAPGGVGQGLDQMGFGCALRIVLVMERFQMGLITLEILGGHDDDLGCEAVAEGVQIRLLFACLGFGAGGVL